ncbi:MAG: 2,3-bisphosphoglycerate-independent phosphoglycerate mutase, partial [bacterium]|nr:2,3-bisphosphoglycerate-independent phosphoglycerate mutase [bacterium]
MNVPLVVLIVLDGWGIAPSGEGNAVSGEHIPNFNKFWHGYPHTSLSASGESVGLPRGEAGNTETGHLNLGAGRIIYQDLLRINVSIAEGSFFKNTAFLDAINHSKKNNANLHLLGLVGGGSVHSNIEHLYALLHLCKEKQFTSVFLHLFTDGRDSPPTAAANYISQIEKHLKEIGLGTIASVMGRYWAMDRDQHWDRTQKCYDALTQGTGKLVTNIQDAIEASYKEGIMDEFINPILVTKDNLPLALIKENDSVIFYNFRIDRPRQLSRAFVFEDLQRESSALQVDFDPYAVKYKKSHLSKSPEEI